MIFENENETVRKINLECDCCLTGCTFLEISQFKDDKFTCIAFYKKAINVTYKPVWYGIIEYVKSVWYALAGKDYFLHEVCINPENIKQLKEAINSLEEE